MGLGLGPGKEPENLTSNWGADYMEYPNNVCDRGGVEHRAGVHWARHLWGGAGNA